MRGNLHHFILALLSVLLFQTTSAAVHSLGKIDQVFEEEAIPPELVKLSEPGNEETKDPTGLLHLKY